MSAHPITYYLYWLYNRSLEYLEGKGVSKDPEKAFSLNAKAAEHGYHDAVLAMGWFYLNGIGVAEDRDLSWNWYRKSARQGDPRAMFSLGDICYIEKNYSGAHTWFTRAARAGHKKSLYWLGKLYWKGYGIDQDRKQALALFAQASKAGVQEAKRVLRFLSRRKG
jgi:TPR repeat protein